MNTNEKLNKVIDNFNRTFNELKEMDNLNISSIEDISLSTKKQMDNILNNHVEELIQNQINEKELISKKNKNSKN